MKKSTMVDRSTTPDGNNISLFQHDGNYSIRVGAVELMSTRQNNSERELGQVACQHHKSHKAQPNILVGGLGFGYTLASVLEQVGPKAQVTVAELLPCIVAWNQDNSLPLAHKSLADSRVTVVNKDVRDLLGHGDNKYDVIILDIDNGPAPLTAKTNESLYTRAGLEILKASLKQSGTLAIWSADNNRLFMQRMKKTGLTVNDIQVRAHKGKGSVYTVFLGRNLPFRRPNKPSTPSRGKKNHGYR